MNLFNHSSFRRSLAVLISSLVVCYLLSGAIFLAVVLHNEKRMDEKDIPRADIGGKTKYLAQLTT